MTDKQVKTRWVDVKKTIKTRPLLAYIVGIPIEKWDGYMHSTPQEGEVNRIYDAIRADRAAKTQRVREELGKMVGYRESKIYSKKIGISDTTIRDILENKKTTAGYEVIDRLEVYISAVNPDFEVSLENSLSKERLVKNELEEIASEIRSISNGLLREAFELVDIGRDMRAKTDWNGSDVKPSQGINRFIERLDHIKDSVDLMYTTYIKKL